jgi:crotonobetainyl-CoA:carnitine CoA-transferase CaiB-like acyl-CoA transferase
MIDVSGAEALMRYLEYTLLLYDANREVRERLGGLDVAVSVYTFIPVKDGWAFIAGYTDPNFGAICRIMGRPELAQDPRFRTLLDRTQPDNRAAIGDEIARWSVNYTSSEILAKVLADPGARDDRLRPGELSDADARRGPLVGSRVHGPAGRSDLRAPYARGARVADDANAASPEVPCRPPGFDTERVFERLLGLGLDKLAELRARGII